ncbi:class I SAM-dependent methyltransferase [Arenimonas fontis]|nr:class I SAM-dependent methyltransferase [Arenimonas fontis]
MRQARLDAVLDRALTDLSGSYGGFMIHLGNRLGLYRAMAGAGPLSAEEVAHRAGCAERYVQEWLNSQVAGGYVAYHPASRTYELGTEEAAVLADEDSALFFPNAWQVVASMWADEERSVEAFRTGRGVAWGEHDGRLFCGVAAFYRNGYRTHLVRDWLPALDGMVARLEAGARVADVGCGHGHSTLLMAQAFPQSRFWGFDPHAASIEEARRNAEAAGLGDRVVFEVRDAAGYPALEYDLICFFDCLHDLGAPDLALRHAAESLAPDGSVMMVEPFAHDRVEDNVGPVGRLYYSASSVLCCAHAISEGGRHVLGAQAGEARLAQLARANGLSRFRRAAETSFNLVLEARP